MNRAPPILAMEAVTKVYPTARGPITVLNEVSLEIREGEFVAVTGPSGSGKTTLLNLAGFLDRPTGGRIRFRGDDVSRFADLRLRDLRKRHVGMVFQGFHLLPRRTVIENVLFRFRYLDTPLAEARALSAEALARVGLSDLASQPVRHLSGGEMQRVAIARAIALPPALLLVDEPTGSLDAASATVVMDHFRDLNRQGLTVLLATHNPSLLGYASRRLQCHSGMLSESLHPPPSLPPPSTINHPSSPPSPCPTTA